MALNFYIPVDYQFLVLDPLNLVINKEKRGLITSVGVGTCPYPLLDLPFEVVFGVFKPCFH